LAKRIKLDANKKVLQKHVMPAHPETFMCDKCGRSIGPMVRYYKFVYTRGDGTFGTSRAHIMCLDMNPEVELH